MNLKQENLFVDDLDGQWTLGYNFGEKEGTQTLCIFDDNGEENSDTWLYPNDLGFDHVLNLWFEDNIWKFDLYSLPKNWREIVTQNKGRDGKKSILDIMF
jgi:hypothetical protein